MNGKNRDLDVKLGSLLHIVKPWAKFQITRTALISGTREKGFLIQADIDHDVERKISFPRLTAIRQFTSSRCVAISTDLTAYVGQKLKVIDVKDRLGFKKLRLCADVQAGWDAQKMRPMTNFELDSYSIKPLWHPLVLGGALGLYMGMIKYRFPLPLSLSAGTVKVAGRPINMSLDTKIQRMDDNLIPTVGIKGVLLEFHV